MNAEPALRLEIMAYDPKLRIRWGRHSEKFIIERHQPCSDPRLANSNPPADDASPIRKDLWEGWKEGFVHVLTVPRDLAHWRFIAPELARLDFSRQRSMHEANRLLDEEHEKKAAADEKAIDDWSSAAARDAYDHMSWFRGDTIAVTKPTDEPNLVDSGLGFKVRDKRGVRAL